MSVITELYTATKTWLEEITDYNHVAIWNNQLQREDEDIIFKYPGLFIEFQIDWNRLWTQPAYPNNYFTAPQDGAVIMTIHCTFEKYVNETAAFEEFYPLVEKVYRKLINKSGDNFTSLIRVAERQDSDHTNVIDWQIDFSCQVTDCGEDLTQTDPPQLEKIDVGNYNYELDDDLKIDNDVIRTGKKST